MVVKSVIKYQNKKLVLEYCVTSKSMKEIKDYININSRRCVREKIIKSLINDGLLSYTNKNLLIQVIKNMYKKIIYFETDTIIFII